MACRLPVGKVSNQSNFIAFTLGYRPENDHGLRRNVIGPICRNCCRLTDSPKGR